MMRASAVGGIVALVAVTLTWPVQAGNTESLEPLLHSSTWLNGRATARELRDKVVVVDVFTVDCINCKNVTPNLRSLWRRERKDVAVVGVHTPETPYERDRGHVIESLRDLGVTWPVAIDDSALLWNVYRVEAWPTQLIFDRSGRLRKTVVGDSQDGVVNETVRALQRERPSNR